MRKIVLYMLVSADGVAESPGDYILEFDDRMRANLAKVIAAQDAVVIGRRGYDEWAGYWPGSQEEPFASFINGVDKYVVTTSAPDVEWDRTTVVSGSVADLLADLKAEPGGDIGVHGSVALAQSLLSDGLIDELRLVVGPVVAGKGRRLFAAEGAGRRLELLEAEQTPSGSLLLGYRVGGLL